MVSNRRTELNVDGVRHASDAMVVRAYGIALRPEVAEINAATMIDRAASDCPARKRQLHLQP